MNCQMYWVFWRPIGWIKNSAYYWKNLKVLKPCKYIFAPIRNQNRHFFSKLLRWSVPKYSTKLALSRWKCQNQNNVGMYFFTNAATHLSNTTFLFQNWGKNKDVAQTIHFLFKVNEIVPNGVCCHIKFINGFS